MTPYTHGGDVLTARARFGGDVSSFVPSIILDTVVERLKIKFPETETADE